jgi:orotidine-5'-phosphate decarboxylase
MGSDSVIPFLKFEGKWVFLLALTSNPGADDFQLQRVGEELLYQKVVRTSLEWAKGLPGHLGFVTGATRPEYIAAIRAIAPENFFLVPGVGAQGGDLEAVCANGMNTNGGLLINASRSIIYASEGEDFAERAAAEAKKMQEATARQLK